MNLLTVRFHGICVHFNRKLNPSLDLPAAHRVVLPYFPNGLVWNGKKILVHEPTVTLSYPGFEKTLEPKEVTFTLDKVSLTGEVTPTFECPPHLKEILPDMEVDPAVVVGKQKPATMYFDLDEGIFNGIELHGSAATELTIPTETTEMVLIERPWHGGETPWLLPMPATITVSNMAKDPEADGMADFILSFAVGKPFPPCEEHVKPPCDAKKFQTALEHAMSATLECLKVQSGDIGPGCSNSQFP